MGHARGVGLRGAGCLLAAVLLGAALSSGAEAATVVPMTAQTLSDYSGQVIAGEVVSVRSYWAQNPRRIESEVTFQNVEYLKGKLADSTTTFKLLVPGGKVDEWQMQVSCSPSFAVGERWVLFLLPTYKTFPVVGLHQGAFRIQQDTEGVARVYAAEGGAVINVGADGFVQAVSRPAHESAAPVGKAGDRGGAVAEDAAAAKRAERPRAEDSLVSAEGMRVQFVVPPTPAAQAMSYDDFVAVIRPVLQRSKAHHLTLPAGQPDLSGYKPVPMKRSPGSTGASLKANMLRGGVALPKKVDPPLPQSRAPQPAAGESAKEVRR